jgi:hypothetical protein
MPRTLTITAFVLISGAILGGIWFAGRGHVTVDPNAARPLILPTASPTPESHPVAYTVCAEGWGWARPSRDDQRRYLASLGGEFEQFAAYDPPFQGASTSDDGGKTNVWHYVDFWAFVAEPRDEHSAVTLSGLWSASPDSSACDRSSGLTLLLDRAVTDVSFAGDTASFTSAEVPGYFQYVQYSLPIDIHYVGYRLYDEEGRWIDGCCS